MFDIIKEKVTVGEVFEKLTGVGLKSVGEWNAPDDEEDTCPFCNHHNCFRINNASDFFKCFSCDSEGDVIKFVELAHKVSPLDAARAIAKEFKIEIPSSYSPMKEMFRLAAEYYHRCFMEDTRKYAELNDQTPMEYQINQRGHPLEQLQAIQIGWSDGKLIQYLEGVGFEKDLIKESGLMNSKENDFFPSKCFIYPHMVGRNVGHITFKDPSKKLEWQLKKVDRDPLWAFYNQNAVKDAHTVVVVEGENDQISSQRSAPEGVAVVACIGMISGAQIEWLVEKCVGKKVITIFDPDDGGDKYRTKIVKAAPRFTDLRCVDLPRDPGDDVDDLIKKGSSLEDILKTAVVIKDSTKPSTVTLESSSGESVQVEIEAGDGGTGTVVMHENAYYRIKYKDGAPIKTKLTNFSIKLRNIYIQGDKREREVIFIREDGKRSRPVNVSSENKVSLRSFKSLVANAVDASFYGREEDLAMLWDFVYQGVSEREVYLPNSVGHLRENNGWLFQDCFVGNDGGLYRKGDDGVIWVGGGDCGIKPVALTDDDSDSPDVIPALVTDLDREGRKEIEGEFIRNFIANIGDVGVALTILGWTRSSVYSNALFDWRRDFPFLFFWGRHGRGKTFIARWMAAIFGTDNCGYITISGLKRNVGFLRKLAYYASLPVIVDEVRADRDTTELYGTFRSWYQRSGRVLGIKEDFGVKEQKVLSTFIFVGQDQFSDDALRQRCISVRIPVENRELQDSFNWIESHRSDLSAIGLEWILESSKHDVRKIIDRIDDINTDLKNCGSSQRTSRNWALVAAFGEMIAKEYVPDFDFVSYIRKASSIDMAEQEDENILAQFFQVVEGLQASEKLDGRHITLCSDRTLAVWMTEVFRVVEKELINSAREDFSKKALSELLKEEAWCIQPSTPTGHKAVMGDGVQRRVLKFNLESAPEYVQVLGECNAKSS